MPQVVSELLNYEYDITISICKVVGSCEKGTKSFKFNNEFLWYNDTNVMYWLFKKSELISKLVNSNQWQESTHALTCLKSVTSYLSHKMYNNFTYYSLTMSSIALCWALVWTRLKIIKIQHKPIILNLIIYQCEYIFSTSIFTSQIISLCRCQPVDIILIQLATGKIVAVNCL